MDCRNFLEQYGKLAYDRHFSMTAILRSGDPHLWIPYLWTAPIYEYPSGNHGILVASPF